MVIFLALASSGCQVVLTAGVEARQDGSGVVRAAIGLDDEAALRLGDPTEELRLDDLRQSGWEITGPTKGPDGLTWVRAAKPFATPAEADLAAAELSGPQGPFRDFRLQRERSFFKTRTTFTGLIDLTAGLAGLSDPALDAAVGDFPGRPGAEGLRVRLEAELPGHTESWEPPVGEQLRVRAESETWNIVPVAGAAAAVVLAVAALALTVTRRQR